MPDHRGRRAGGGAPLDAIEALAVRLREAGVPPEWDLEAAIDDGLARPPDGPVILVEPADNIGGGAPGDCTSILRSFLRRRLQNAAVVINDRPPSQLCRSTSPAAAGRSAWAAAAVSIQVELEVCFCLAVRRRFRLEDTRSHMAAAAA